MDPVQYFMSAPFWFSTSVALLFALLVGYRFTGPTSGRMKYQINFANGSNRLKLFSAFLFFEVVFNLAFVFSGSVL